MIVWKSNWYEQYVTITAWWQNMPSEYHLIIGKKNQKVQFVLVLLREESDKECDWAIMIKYA